MESGPIVEEVKIWNTPLIGAYMLWRFTGGYCKNHKEGDAPIALLHFIANAVLTNKLLMKPISDKRDNLQSYISSFENNKGSDLLLNIQERIREKKLETLKSIDIAVAQGLLFWEPSTGKLLPRANLKKADRGKGIKDVYVREGKKAEILGKWFAEHSIIMIASYFKLIL